MKHRIVELNNGLYAIQTKFLFWWFYWRNFEFSWDWPYVLIFWDRIIAEELLHAELCKPKRKIKSVVKETSTKEINQ